MTDCIEWKGNTNKGYGTATIKVHRVAYLLQRVPTDILLGDSIRGMHVRHLCGNRVCMNPEHLALGTAKENNQDMLRMGRRYRKLTFDQAKEIRSLYKPGHAGGLRHGEFRPFGQRWLARKYGVSQNAVRLIIKGETYTE